LTGLGMCCKKDREIEEKIIYDMVKTIVLDSVFVPRLTDLFEE